MRPRLIGEIAEKDGMLCILTGANCWYPLDGSSGLAFDFVQAFGRAQKGDVGKRVYNSRGVLQMENDDQRKERLVHDYFSKPKQSA